MDEQLETISQVKSTLVDLAVRFGPRVLAAILILTIGVVVSRWLGRWVERALLHFELEPPVRLLLSRMALHHLHQALSRRRIHLDFR